MNATINNFFQKYHAVPASSTGPEWNQASDAALLGWAREDCRTANLAGLAQRMGEIAQELQRRNNQKPTTDAEKCLRYDRLLAILNISTRIGWGWNK